MARRGSAGQCRQTPRQGLVERKRAEESGSSKSGSERAREREIGRRGGGERGARTLRSVVSSTSTYARKRRRTSCRSEHGATLLLGELLALFLNYNMRGGQVKSLAGFV